MNVSASMAKLAGIQKSIKSALTENISRAIGRGDPQYRHSFASEEFGHFFNQANAHLETLRQCLPDLYSDFHTLPSEPAMAMMTQPDGVVPMHFSRQQMERLSRDIDQIFEIRARAEPAAPAKNPSPRRVFISHGSSKDWYDVQAHIERNLKINSIELAQEPNKGQTIIEKLEGNAEMCDSAVIVMSGDDTDSEGQAKVRENVMHEIGYFQGKYGRRHVVLLHEEGANVPSNLSGITYVPYPKETIHATFGKLDQELKAIYGF